MATIRWCPPLPTIGRAGPRSHVQSDWTFQRKLEHYLLEVVSSPKFFVRRVPYTLRCRLNLDMTPSWSGFLADLVPEGQYRVIMAQLWFNPSLHFRRKLFSTLQLKNGLHLVEQWFHTADGVILPMLLMGSSEPPYEVTDSLAKFALENCANNYAQFISRLKVWKKKVRKHYADPERYELPFFRDIATLSRIYLPVIEGEKESHKRLQCVLICTQSRATGLADSTMGQRSMVKFLNTIQEPYEAVSLNFTTLMSVTSCVYNTRGSRAKISAGPTACLESTRQNEGTTGFLKYLASNEVLGFRYDLKTLEPRRLVRKVWRTEQQGLSTPHIVAVMILSLILSIVSGFPLYILYGVSLLGKQRRHVRSYSYEPVLLPCRTAEDVLNWAIQTVLLEPFRARAVRVHVVLEPSKARTVTLASYAYMVIMGIFGHLWQKTMTAQNVRSGLQGGRHLWNLIWRDLHPQNKLWERLDCSQVIWGLSTDLEEATDFGNPSVARQIWHALILKSSASPGFPLALAVLAKTLYCGKRYVLATDPKTRDVCLVIKRRGWFMGDPMTKTMLTMAQDYVYRTVQPAIGSEVGDDAVALDNDRDKLDQYPDELRRIGFKVSEDDTYTSKYFIFYCEEASLIPRRPSDSPMVSARRGKSSLCYVDYPRIRLMLDLSTELDRYSYTTLGRTSLLGKEVKWTYNLNKSIALPMLQASLLQKLLLPTESTTICGFLPLELGGDGSFYPNAEFVTQYIEGHALNPREVFQRMEHLITNKFGYKFVRTERMNQVTHKYHLRVPKFLEFRHLLPDDAVIQPRDDYHRALISSLQSSTIETPEKTINRLLKSYYYKDILRGNNPGVLSLGGERVYGKSADVPAWAHDREATYQFVARFIQHWVNPGFQFRDQEPYFINRDKVEALDYLSLGWTIEPAWRQDNLSVREEWESYISSSWDLLSEEDQLLDMIAGEEPSVPPRVRDRLNLFMESDNLILLEVSKWDTVPDQVLLVSGDRKLAGQILRLLRRRNPLAIVWLVMPIVHLLGRLWEGPIVASLYNRDTRRRTNGPELDLESPVLEDPGALMHTDMTVFQDGQCDERYFVNPVRAYPTLRYPGVYTVFVQIRGEEPLADEGDWDEAFSSEWEECIANSHMSAGNVPGIGLISE